jgi:hypothetical protein
MSETLPPKREPTPWERFVSLARKVTQTPKTEVEKREQEWRKRREEKGGRSRPLA